MKTDNIINNTRAMDLYNIFIFIDDTFFSV